MSDETTQRQEFTDRLDERRFLVLHHLSFYERGKRHEVPAGTEVVWPRRELPTWLELARLDRMVREIGDDS